MLKNQLYYLIIIHKPVQIEANIPLLLKHPKIDCDIENLLVQTTTRLRSPVFTMYSEDVTHRTITQSLSQSAADLWKMGIYDYCTY